MFVVKLDGSCEIVGRSAVGKAVGKQWYTRLNWAECGFQFIAFSLILAGKRNGGKLG
jgi:hypothetical protein